MSFDIPVFPIITDSSPINQTFSVDFAPICFCSWFVLAPFNLSFLLIVWTLNNVLNLIWFAILFHSLLNCQIFLIVFSSLDNTYFKFFNSFSLIHFLFLSNQKIFKTWFKYLHLSKAWSWQLLLIIYFLHENHYTNLALK